MPVTECTSAVRFMAITHGARGRRIDETDRYGVLLSEAARQALPISFLCNGQRIPDDLEPASKERLSTMILGERTKTEVLHSVGATA